MAMTAPGLVALNGGEWSKRLWGRYDQQKYLNALRRCENFIPLVHGPVIRRPGLQVRLLGAPQRGGSAHRPLRLCAGPGLHPRVHRRRQRAEAALLPEPLGDHGDGQDDHRDHQGQSRRGDGQRARLQRGRRGLHQRRRRHDGGERQAIPRRLAPRRTPSSCWIRSAAATVNTTGFATYTLGRHGGTHLRGDASLCGSRPAVPQVDAGARHHVPVLPGLRAAQADAQRRCVLGLLDARFRRRALLAGEHDHDDADAGCDERQRGQHHVQRDRRREQRRRPVGRRRRAAACGC